MRLARRAAPNSTQDDGIFKNRLEGGEDDGEDKDADEEGAAVGDGVDDGVFVELAARGLEPEAADPEEDDGHEEIEAVGVVVERGGVKIGDVEGEDADGDVSAGGAEAAELLDVGYVVAASTGC